MKVIVGKHLTAALIIATGAIAIAGCSQMPSDADIRGSMETLMTQKNGRSADPMEPSVNIDRLCSERLGRGARGEFREVGSIVAKVGAKQTMAQGPISMVREERLAGESRFAIDVPTRGVERNGYNRAGIRTRV